MEDIWFLLCKMRLPPPTWTIFLLNFYYKDIRRILLNYTIGPFDPASYSIQRPIKNSCLSVLLTTLPKIKTKPWYSEEISKGLCLWEWQAYLAILVKMGWVGISLLVVPGSDITTLQIPQIAKTFQMKVGEFLENCSITLRCSWKWYSIIMTPIFASTVVRNTPDKLH